MPLRRLSTFWTSLRQVSMCWFALPSSRCHFGTSDDTCCGKPYFSSCDFAGLLEKMFHKCESWILQYIRADVSVMGKSIQSNFVGMTFLPHLLGFESNAGLKKQCRGHCNSCLRFFARTSFVVMLVKARWTFPSQQ